MQHEILEILDQLRLKSNRQGLSEGDFTSAKKEVVRIIRLQHNLKK